MTTLKQYAETVLSDGGWTDAGGATGALGPPNNNGPRTSGQGTMRLRLTSYSAIPPSAIINAVTIGFRSAGDNVIGGNTARVGMANYGDPSQVSVNYPFDQGWQDKELALDASQFSAAQLNSTPPEVNVGAPSNFGGRSAKVDAVWLTVDYTAVAARAKRWDGSAWQDASIKRWDGTQWVTTTLKRWDGSAWV